MKTSNGGVIGIVGGLGPKAGSNLFDHICRLTNARCDQEHKSVVLASFPANIVDRSAFLDGDEGINPAFGIAEVIENLGKFGVSVVGIPCNTAHVPEIYNVILKQLNKIECKIKLLHMPMETCQYLQKYFPHIKRIGIMATNGTYKSGMYESLLLKMNFQPITPDFKFQNEIIHDMIYNPHYGIKCSGTITQELHLKMKVALDYFKEQDVEAIVLGCTELSCAFSEYELDKEMLIVDSNEILARALIKETTVGISTFHKVLSDS